MTTQTAIPQPARASTAPVEATHGLASRAIRGGAVLMAGRLLVQVFIWGVTLGVARLLTPFDYGMMTTGMIFLGLADLLADAGVGRALVQKKDLQSIDVSRVFTWSLGLAGLLYAVLFGIAGPAESFMELDGFATFLRVLGLLLLLTPFRAVSIGLLDRNLHLGRQATTNILSGVVQSALVLGLAFAGAGYWALTVGALAGRLIEAVLLAWLARWTPRLAWPRRGDGLLAFGMHVSLASLLWFAYSNADFAIVGRMFGPEILGAYALAFQLISLPVQKLTANVNQVAYPVFCRLQHDKDRLRDWFLRLTVMLGFLGVPVLAGMALVAPDACRILLTERWAEAILPLQLLAGVGALMVVSTAIPPLLNALGRPELNTRYAAACTLLMPLGFWLGGRMAGLTGVCIAWIVIYPIIVGMFVFLTRRITGIGVWGLTRPQIPVLAAVAFMMLCVLGVRAALGWDTTENAWLRLGLCIGTGIVAYGGFIFVVERNTILADIRALIRQLRGKEEVARPGRD